MADTSSIVSDNKFLEIYSNKYILTTNLSKDQVVIDLRTSELKKETRGSGDSQTLVTRIGLKAIYGICELEYSNYLIAATQSFTIGSLYNKNIQQLKEIQFFPINPQREINLADQKYIDMMQSIFQTKMFYFSDEYDLTNSFQRFIKNKVDKNKYNPNFCYNECYLHDFIKNGCQEWISPFISGYVKIDYCQLDDTVVNFILISRRDKRRAGMRFISRGTDLDGNPTNMAETEQIIVLTKGQYNNIYSFIQTRGSMPFLWNQKPNLMWAPRGVPIGEEAENIEFCRKHFADQEKLYSRQVLVNLIDKKGNTQLELGQYFQKMVEALKDKNLKYIWFDFHHECRKMKYENLQKLLDMFKEDLDDIGYFEFQYTKDKIETPSIKKLQKGTVRTNCMDCLDRTNVVQSVIARKVLHEILYFAGVTSKTASTALEKLPEKLEDIFRANWTKNADVISILYTGTGALKTDFTRTGKRTKQGAINDGINSISRYFYGNFFDGHKQDCIDLLLGKIRPKETKIKQGVNPILFFICFLLVGPLILKPQLDKFLVGENAEAGLLTSFCGFVSPLASILILALGAVSLNQFFVQKPTLPQ
ncbi:hypothetical protein ABPG72_019737 [Tetrahymena utriculariae]